MRQMAFVMAAAIGIAIGAADVAVHATVAPGVPEINGSMVSTALGLLAGGVLVLRARRSK